MAPAILRVWDDTRSRLPPVREVRVRPNRVRLASLSRAPGGHWRLNLATAVVSAGEEVWRLVAPALEGDPESRRKLRERAAPGLEGRRGARRRRGASAAGGPAPLPETPCEGTPDERERLVRLFRRIRDEAGAPAALPAKIQLRVSRRMTSSLGSFRYRGESRRITISAHLFRPGLEDLLEDTVRHEMAHLADQVSSPEGRTGHGRSWRAWALRLGARPERRCSPDDAERLRGR